MSALHKTSFYGTATVGTKGQIVIPVNARDELGLKEGDKVMIVGMKDCRMLGVWPIESVEGMLAEMTEKLATIQNAIDQTKKER